MKGRIVPGVLRAALLGLILAIAPSAFAAKANGAPPSGASAGPSASAALDYRALADLLRNAKTREELIATLSRLAAREQPPQSTTPTHPGESQSFSASLLSATTEMLQQSTQALESVRKLWRQLSTAPGAGERWSMVARTGWRLVLVIAAAFFVLVALRRAARRPLELGFAWAEKGRRRSRLPRRLVALVLAAAAGAAGVALAYLAGSSVAVALAHGAPRMAARLAPFLNAFVIVEAALVGLRIVLAEQQSIARLWHWDADLVRYFHSATSFLVALLGYAALFVTPELALIIEPLVGRSFLWLVSLVAFVVAVRVILKRRHEISSRIEAYATQNHGAVGTWLLRVAARGWHGAVIAYLVLVLVVFVTSPGDVLPVVGMATLNSLIVVTLGAIAFALLDQLLGDGIRLPQGLAAMLPTLERRVNRMLPFTLAFVRTLIGIIIALSLISVWQVADVLAWLSGPSGTVFLGRAVDVVLVIALSLLAWLVFDSLIESRLNGHAGKEPSARTRTLLTLFRNAYAVVLATISVMMLLAALGVNIGPLIAGAGVLGLAVSFGSQKLVQDVINGVFIQLENAINTGDVISVGGITGTTERITIRSVGIRDISGTYHIVPFSTVSVVSNFTRDFAYHKAEYGIAYRENIDEACQRLREAFDELASDPQWQPKILEPINIAGVTELGASSVNIRVMIKTTPGDQWALGRAYNRLVKLHFDEAGIEIPFPQTTVWFGEDKAGAAPPAHLRLGRGRAPAAAQAPSAAPETGAPAPAGAPERAG